MTNLAALPFAPTVVLRTHDLDVARYADTIIHLRDGRVTRVEAGLLSASA